MATLQKAMKDLEHQNLLALASNPCSTSYQLCSLEYTNFSTSCYLHSGNNTISVLQACLKMKTAFHWLSTRSCLRGPSPFYFPASNSVSEEAIENQLECLASLCGPCYKGLPSLPTPAAHLFLKGLHNSLEMGCVQSKGIPPPWHPNELSHP